MLRVAGGSLLLILLAVGSAGCGPAVDLTKGLQVQNVVTGWLNAGVVAGNNKIVPSIALTLRNVSDQQLPVLQVNAVFKRVQEDKELGARFLAAAGRSLPVGASTDTLTFESPLGYTGTDPHQDLLTNSQFVDVKVELFAKYGSTQWARIGTYPIARVLFTK